MTREEVHAILYAPAAKPLPELTPLQQLQRAYIMTNTDAEIEEATRAAALPIGWREVEA